MIIIMTGPPGAGKGTMSRFIIEKYNVPAISTGDILRQEIKSGTELGIKAKSTIDKGNLVPDEIVINIIKNYTKDLGNGYLLDGFPRNLSQAMEFDKMLEENNHKIDMVINVEASDEIIINRVKGRRICPKCSKAYHVEFLKPIKEDYCDKCDVLLEKRVDDNEENARNRLEVYHKQTKPLIDYYNNNGILINIENSYDSLEEARECLNQHLQKFNL